MSNPHRFRKVGKMVEIHEPVAIINPALISVSNFVRLSEFVYISAGLGTHVGNFVHIANHASISGGGVCILEDFVGVCAGVRIITGSDDVAGSGIPTPTIPTELQPKYRSVYRSYVHCRSHVFLASNVIVHPGVTLGEGAVVASGSVVTHDLEPWGIFMGAPARRVKVRPAKKVLALQRQLYEDCEIEPGDCSELEHSLRSL